MQSSPAGGTAVPQGPNWTTLFQSMDGVLPGGTARGTDGANADMFLVKSTSGTLEVQTSNVHGGDPSADGIQIGTGEGIIPLGGPITWVRARGVGAAATAWHTVSRKLNRH